MSIFCERLRLLRGKRSQSAFAKKLGIKQVTYGRYELGTREPDLDTLIHIGLTLCVSVDWLLGLSDECAKNEQENKKKLEGLKDAMRKLIDNY